MSRIASPSAEPAIADVAALMGDPGRSAMLCALIDGEMLCASELARCAGLAANAASAHLSKLVAGGLLQVRVSGRRRLYRLSNEHVARALEALSVIAKPPRIVALSQSRISRELACARSCYDHLAGRLGVSVTESLLRKNMIVARADRTFVVTPRGTQFFSELGIDIEMVRTARRHFARQCMDWTERRAHLAGALGAALRGVVLERGWVVRARGSRALMLTDQGRSGFRTILSIEV